MGVTMIGWGVIWPVIPVFASELGAGGVQIGLILASFNISRSISNPFVGPLSDRLGRKAFMVAGLLLIVLVSCLYVAVNSVEALIGVRLVHGFGAVLVGPVSMALVADIAPDAKLGRYMGTMGMAMMLGMGVGPTLGGVIKDLFGMDAAFYTMGGLVATTLVGVLVFIPGASREKNVGKRGPGATPPRILMRDRTLQAIFLGRFFGAAGQGAVYTFLPLLAIQLHLSGFQIGVTLGANILLIALFQRLFGALADRGAPAVFMVAGSGAAGLAALGMSHAGGFAALLFLNCCMGMANGIVSSGGNVLSGRLGRRHGMGSVMAFVDSAWSLGMIFSPILAGLVLDARGVASVFHFGGAFVLLGAMVLMLLLKGARITRL